MSTMQLIDRLRTDYRDDTSRVVAGAELLVNLPHEAEFAFLHSIFPPLSRADIDNLEAQLSGILSKEFAGFLQIANGIDCFFGAISLFGKRLRNDRSIEATISQPFDIVRANGPNDPNKPGVGLCQIGSYKADGSRIVSSNAETTIFRIGRFDNQVLNKWPSLAEFLASEIERLRGHFDAEGKRIDYERPTCPVSVH